MHTEVTLIFDIGKTNKKALLFNNKLELVYEEEKQFEEVYDDDKYLCDDFDKIELWLIAKVNEFLQDASYKIKRINFATYGATLVYIDNEGKRLTPVYNYLKPLDCNVDRLIYEQWGGVDEFSLKTASPALKMLNSGFQILKLKHEKPNVYNEVKHVLHLPQYLSFLLTKEIKSEATSIGCHTALWDFDKMSYHDWLAAEGIKLPKPEALDRTYSYQSDVEVGIGIHDSSASLIPYLKAATEPFILVSTGTWCINMNPYNQEPLTHYEFERDCLSYLSYEQKPVKSSRLFLGHIHDVNIQRLNSFYNVEDDLYKNLEFNSELLRELMKQSNNKRVFFKYGIHDNYIDELVNLTMFENFENCYYQFVLDLALLASESINLIMSSEQKTENIYITGGFARNQQFIHALAAIYNKQSVFTSDIDNATSLGAALVIDKNTNTKINLGLNQVRSIL